MADNTENAEPKTPQTPSEDTTAADNDAAFRKELEAALNEQGGQEEAPADPAQDSPPDDGGDGDKPKDGEGDQPAATEAPAAPAIDDALMERAVKAGLSLADARTFTAPEVLERVCTALEASAPKVGDDNPADDSKEGDGDAGPKPADIPELSEDDYDADLVKAFNGLRSLAIQQGETIQALIKSANDKAAQAEAEKAEAEKAKAEAEKAAALEKRKSLRLAAPGGVPGKTRTTGDDDGMSELVAELERKFGG